MDPNFLLAHRVTALAYLYEDKNEQAVQEFERGVELSHSDPVAEAYLARAYAHSGRQADARAILDKLTALTRDQYVPPTEIAADYAALGDTSNAFTWLNRGFEERASALPYLKVDRAYESLRGDPRFADLLHRLNLQ